MSFIDSRLTDAPLRDTDKGFGQDRVVCQTFDIWLDIWDKTDDKITLGKITERKINRTSEIRTGISRGSYVKDGEMWGQIREPCSNSKFGTETEDCLY
jgi:hypothetical protein